MNVAPATVAVRIAIARLTNSCSIHNSFVTSTHVRNCPHVAPGTLAVIVGLTGLALSGFGGDLLIAIVFADREYVVTILVAFAVSISSACVTFGVLLITTTDVRNGPHVAPGALAVIVGHTGLTFGGLGGNLITSTDVRNGPHIAPGRFTVIIDSAGCTFGGFAHSNLLIEEHHSVDSGLHLFA